MDNMKSTGPIHRVSIECYHYKTTTIREKDADGNEKTRTETRRVSTYTGHNDFRYDRQEIKHIF